ncbi:acetoacetate decarboxylase family protein [Gammaproteobacteria bacterium]|nr:acetoacetate decarboxylase family protein [Gammaproteobacteria bacterium]
MSYKFVPDKMYRMPIQFGPSLAPRQVPDGINLDYINSPNTTTLAVSFRSNPEQLEALLPGCFALGEAPIVTISCSQMTNIDWLAGRGYSMIGISFPAKYSGKKDRLQGSFLCVLFENMCEPIITGREELGFSKVYSEISGPLISEDKAKVSASWQGFKFLDIEVNQLVESSTESAKSTTSKTDGMLHYKYIPKTGDWGDSDIEYPTFTPTSSDQSRVHKYFKGLGRISWNKAQWEDLPTLYNLVNTLADLEIIECLDSSLTYSVGGKKLRKQRILI